jgi:formylglycine-generating enzyme required for sulfatase activity
MFKKRKMLKMSPRMTFWKKGLKHIVFATIMVSSAVFAEVSEANTQNINGENKLITLVKVPAGTTRMSSSNRQTKEKVTRTTEISEFYMSAYETSYEKWKKVYDWGLKNGYEFIDAGEMVSHKLKENTEVPVHTDKEPVFNISWYDCVLWCNAVSEMEGRIPCYYTDKEHVNIYRKGNIDIDNSWVKWDVDGYRLPTEAEWNYACDWMGSWQKKKDVSSWVTVLEYGWDGNNSGGTSHPVGMKKPNTFGLYDMYGNAHEWLWDRFKYVHNKDATKDPKGPSDHDPSPKEPESKVVRRVCRGMLFWTKNHPASKRYGAYPDKQWEWAGFRVATTKNNIK